MNQLKGYSLLLLVFLLISFIACGSGSDSGDSDKSNEPEPLPTRTNAQTSYSRAGEIRDVSYGNIRRFSQKIIVPMGRSREDLTATLERACREIAKEAKAKAVAIFAFRPQDNTSKQYSAGKAVYAPGDLVGGSRIGYPLPTERLVPAR